jgi:hypothetical protein
MLVKRYKDKHLEHNVKWIVACVVLHNILLCLSDDMFLDDEEGISSSGDEVDSDEDGRVGTAGEQESGMDWRLEMMEQVLDEGSNLGSDSDDE